VASDGTLVHVATRQKGTAKRPRKSASQSVAKPPCKCGFLLRAAEEPEIPIVFDERMNEYHIENVAKDGGHSVIYYCPFCGGAAPPSKRQSFFATITRAETERLHELTADVKTIAGAIAQFGAPDDDLDPGTTVYNSVKDDQPPTVTSYRTLRYKTLSSSADVVFTDFGPERGLRMSLTGKYLGEPKN
jgi:hypothetical protein